MLETARMCKLDCILVEDQKSKVIERLHKRGIAQIEFFDNPFLEKVRLERDAPTDRVIEVSSLLLRIRKIIDILQRFEIKEKGFIESLLNVEKEEKIKIPDEYNELKKYSENILREIEDNISIYEKKIPELETKKAEILDKIKKYEKILGLDIKVEYFGISKYLSTSIGLIPKANLISLEQELKKKFNNRFILVKGNEFENKVAIAICVLNESAQELEKIFRKVEFEQIHIAGKGRIKHLLEDLRRNLSIIEKEEKGLLEHLNKLHKEKYRKLLAIEELLRIEKERCEVFNRFGRTKKTILMRLWLQNKDLDEVESILKKETNNLYVIKIDRNPKDAPVLLQNKGLVKNFEVFTRLFSLPAYNGIDATVFLMISYSLFFGIVLTDAVYGFVLILAGIWLNRKFGKYSRNAKNASVILAGGGLFAIIFGILTGSYFGDLLGTYILGKNSQSIALWIDPLYNGNAMLFLIFVCAIGFIHLYIGYFLGAFDALRRGEYKDAFKAYISKYILLFGVLFIAFSNFSIFSSSGKPILPEFFTYIGLLFLIISLILLYMNFGFMVFTDLIGIVGNTLSYARLLAMCITTAGIALSFNLLAKMSLNIPIVGFILAPITFIFGHIINILINSLGGFVHSLRLNYVEFFGTFYRSGGKEFKPFKEERKYTY